MDVNSPDRIPDWKDQCALERVNICRAFLYTHGFITQTEALKIQQRTIKKIKGTNQ